MKVKQLARSLIPLMAIGVLVTGCGSGGSVKNLVTDLKGGVKTQGSDLYANVSAQLNTNSFSMTSFALPILDPNNSSVNYGSISLTPKLGGGGGELIISVNVSQAARIKSSSEATLPNGTSLPLSLPSGVSVIAIPIGNHGAKIYLAASLTTLMIGSAIPFPILDGVGAYVPGVNLFAPIQFGKISSLVGIFAGAATDQTGLGVFADLSSVLPASLSADLNVIAVSSEVQGLSQSQASAAPLHTIPVRFRAPRVSRYAEKRMYYHLWKASQESSNPELKYE
ncbi:MAG: hypothetical protein KA715_14405 [Xanthomonadaceae bacterium]|nr:hypothetical protein [Xanthomonadaceae bacterium]